MDAAIPLRAAYCVDSGVPEEIFMPADDLTVERVRVFSTAALIFSVSFQYEAVPNEVISWGAVKSLYR